jgi:CDP-glucose 4,6-dehydratase
VEGVVVNHGFWRGRRVFVTGHTGFKGSWLALWLAQAGAAVTGYALPARTEPSLFLLAGVSGAIASIEGDVRDLNALQTAVHEANPEIVFHLAAQSLVRPSYVDPVGTYATNVMGTVHVLEALRGCTARAAVIVTSDKCYENREWVWGYREVEPLGGHDPYSNSKACAELVTAAYRASFFNRKASPRIATARAGNVIGGGDWADDRLVPDMMRAFAARRPVLIRNPHSIRPWQHVLEPLHGYISLAEALSADDGAQYADAWNFGPHDDDARTVEWIVERVAQQWGDGARWAVDANPQPPEAKYLKLDSSKSRQLLGARPRTTLATALEWTVAWYRNCAASPDRARELILGDIARFENLQHD